MKNETDQLIAQGWTETEAREIIAERAEYTTRTTLRKKIAELKNLSTGEFQDSAHANALDTCEENGHPRDLESLTYMRAYAATLSCILDTAGTAH